MSYNLKLFKEAIDHCRWKKVLEPILQQINISDYENQTFEEIFSKIYNICKPIYGLGRLVIYDITSAICRVNKINIDKVFIVGNGPKKACIILGIKPKLYKINNYIKIHYVEIDEILNALIIRREILDYSIKVCKNGDILETFICNWQKMHLT